MKLVDVGQGNYVSPTRVIAIASPDSLPMRRLIQDAKSIGRVIDVSGGKKTQAILITDSEHIILSAHTTQELKERFYGDGDR